MELEIWRYKSDKDSTLGQLMLLEVIGWRLLGFICEDAKRKKKIRGKTRIPAGRYEIKLRNAGGMVRRYNFKFAAQNHRGMLHLQNVPGFRWVYIHVGNDEDDTDGCPLIGMGRDEDALTVSNSVRCYRKIYGRIADAIENHVEGVWITVRDLDRPELPRPPA